MEAISKISLDLLHPASPMIVYAVQNDSEARGVQVNILRDKEAYQIPANAIAIFEARKPDGHAIVEDATIDGSTVTYMYDQQLLAVVGDVQAQIVLSYNNERLATFDFTLRVMKSAVTDEEIESTDYFTALQELLAEIQAVAGSAATFTPQVVDGWLSWTNNGDLPNPSPVYIQGADGTNGTNGKNGKNGKNGTNGTNGVDGATFTPAVSNAGVMSWTNDGGKTNPPSVNLAQLVINALPSAVGVRF